MVNAALGSNASVKSEPQETIGTIPTRLQTRQSETTNTTHAPANTPDNQGLSVFVALSERVFLGYQQQIRRQQPSRSQIDHGANHASSNSRELEVYKAVAQQVFVQYQRNRLMHRSSRRRRNGPNQPVIQVQGQPMDPRAISKRQTPPITGPRRKSPTHSDEQISRTASESINNNGPVANKISYHRLMQIVLHAFQEMSNDVAQQASDLATISAAAPAQSAAIVVPTVASLTASAQVSESSPNVSPALTSRRRR
ncbi:hypothetical protein HZS61_008551 [Fusarium oxysporum f. sp. conglutinans]|uniref:Uncharacterized protein n=1 Tax=Fusarium oxysporum f. sp. conglutinans TaxID=100902 RepID=A0A8H6H1Z1_FUSOX|nr:hypothetical protein HZS61_008551 [Fusarium oxysporum f. sp. conglutinans]KAG7000963.1 hypothetical protein FocnCong_v012618 [Fusarium oxysporum f. sp. conglutinans]KAI8416580.1 hypothetical protein FOFC_02892 [Fusarium oxysporum]